VGVKRLSSPLRPSVRKWLLLKLNTGQYCNQRCTFCHAVEQDVQIDTALAKIRVEQAAAGRFTGILFSGGEPTIRKDLKPLMRQTSKLGMESGLITNGRMFAYDKYTRSTYDAGLREVHVSLHGGTPEVHDHMVGVDGAWKNTTEGIDSLLRHGVCVNVNYVVCEENFRDLDNYLELLGGLPIEKIRISLVFPKGRAREDLDQLPDLLEVTRYIRDFEARHTSQPNLHFDGFPGCLHPRGTPAVELLECDIVAMQEAWEDSWYPTDQGSARHMAACRACSEVSVCAGVHDAYLAQQAKPPLRPVLRPVANSFDYRLGEPIEALQGLCPMPDALRNDLHPLRSVVLKTGSTLRPAITDTADFSLLEIRRTIHEDGQLYVQVGEQVFVDDFSSEFRLLRPSSACSTCERGLSCPGVFEALEEDRLGERVAWIKSRLSDLKGSVLDIGRGSGRFDTVLESLPNLSYTGLEPDKELVDRAQAAHASWTLECTTIEDWNRADRTFDTVLVLYSHNHFRNLVRAYAKIVESLRPGGRLIVVDNVPFAIVREASLIDATRAVESEHPSEHYRNDYSSWVRPELEALGLRLIAEQAVEDGGVNEWYLEFEKPPVPAQAVGPSPAVQG